MQISLVWHKVVTMGAQAISLVKRTAVFATLWLVLSGGASAALGFGVAAALAGAVLSLWLYPSDRPGVGAWRVAGFLPRFLVQSVLGGLDVARRAVDPRLPVVPGWVELKLASRHAEANVLVGGVSSILPGTLAAGPGDGTMAMHVLHMPSFDAARFYADEQRVLALFDRRIDTWGAEHR